MNLELQRAIDQLPNTIGVDRSVILAVAQAAGADAVPNGNVAPRLLAAFWENLRNVCSPTEGSNGSDSSVRGNITNATPGELRRVVAMMLLEPEDRELLERDQTIQSLGMFGVTPEDVTTAWRPLWIIEELRAVQHFADRLWKMPRSHVLYGTVKTNLIGKYLLLGRMLIAQGLIPMMPDDDMREMLGRRVQ